MPDGGPPANRTRCFPVREIAPTVGHVSTVSSRSLQFLVTLASDASEEDVDALLARVAESGGDVRVTPGRESTVVGVIGEPNLLATITLDDLDGIAAVTPVAQAHKLVARETSPDPTLIQVRGRRIGAGYFALIAGPCTVESREQTLATARAVNEAGATMLRGGAFKPRTSPYAFQGLGEEGLRILEEAREETGLPLVTEVMDARQVELVAEAADVLQIGARNMQNFTLLAEVGESDKPVLLKRGPSSSVDELLLAAEYVVNEGNPRVILCERGIRTFERSTRYTLDLGAVPVLKEETHLPVIVDPSHAAGRRSLVPALARAAVAAGADGIIVEAHPAPDEALCDAPQLLPTAEFGEFAKTIITLAESMGKVMG
jgi:3-deoxy-7-phosphoheptulonate synthase